MVRFGIIFCGYNVEPYVRKSLEPFRCAQCYVSAVSVPFKEYSSQEDYRDNTTEILREYKNKQPYGISLVDSPEYILEHEARNLALDNLNAPVDYIFLVDGDEVYTPEQINTIIKFVRENPAAWYKIPLKNYVFDTNTYMEEPFCPPRIFSTCYEGHYNPRFAWDNDMAYNKVGYNGLVDYRTLPNITIPKEEVWVDHYSWLNDEIGKRKVAYQQKHFGHCSFKWVDDHLEFDESYFEKTGESKPKLINAR